ncbi:delta(14)-sterol reductase TM7SF2-like [Battus philenor]|uniref:delta(14)-sterol reductase TM7SF2-like n=1 Tax=Battus philenor TaxID=42288 RepID=UPI0035D0647F
MSTRSGRVRISAIEPSPPKTRKGISPPRSPARRRKSSPRPRSTTRKSPSRKSPTRKSLSRQSPTPNSPTRNSPTRKSPTRKSPTRKSPTRKSSRKSLYNVPTSKSPPKLVTETERKPDFPLKRPAIKSDVQFKLKDISSNIDFYHNTRSRRIEYTMQDLQSDISKNELMIDDKFNNGIDSYLTSIDDYTLRNRKTVEVPSKRSSKLREFIENTPDIRRSFSESKSISKSVSKSIGGVSDEDNSADEFQTRKSVSVTRRLTTPLRSNIVPLSPLNFIVEFYGLWGPALLMVLIPMIVFLILITCSNRCRHEELFELSKYMSVNTWFTYKSLILVLCQYVIQAMFGVIPIFGKSDKDGKKQYFNAFISCIFTVTLIFILDHLKHLNVNRILESYLSLAVISYVFGALLALFLYVTTKRVDNAMLNLFGNTGYFINDFFVGREIHSSIKTLNVKLWISRICNINTLILSILIFKHSFQLPTKDIQMLSLDNYKEFVNQVHIKPTAFLYSLMQLIYSLYFILQENKITSTFYWKSEGLGYLQIVSSALYPYYFTSIAKYVMDVDLDLSTNALIAALTLFLVGFLIMLISNNIKNKFRKNPYHPSVAHLDSMPTLQGNKLLVSNLWGIIRHPNYAGDILIHIALALPGILSEKYIAALPAGLTIVVLLHRVWRDHYRCWCRYGAAWQRYCKRVPSVLIPKIL